MYTHRLLLIGLVSALTAAHAQAALQTFDNKAAFLVATGAVPATGPLPDLGVATGASATVGSVTFSLAPGGNNFFIGANGTGAAPDWYPDTPGNDIALGFENLQVETQEPVFSLGFDFVEPNTTLPPWGGTPVDSTYEVTLFDGATEVGHFTFNAPDDEAAFVGVWSDTAFDRVTIIDVTDDPNVDDDEYFGEFYTGTTPLPCTGDLCVVESKEVFLAATRATAATGIDANGEPLPLPDLGEVRGPITIGDVTFRSSHLFVGTGGDLRVENNDWTLLLPGPDIALAAPGPAKRLEVRFAEPVYAAGFDYVEPQTGPNVGPRFSDATFAVELKAGNRTIRELAFSAPNDVPTFIGMWTDVAFDHITIRTLTGLGTKVFGKFYGGFSPVLLTDLPDILVIDARAGTNGNGLLFRVSAVDGFRTVLNDFGNAQQGQTGSFPAGVAVEANGNILVIDPEAGTNGKGLLFRVHPVTKVRLPLSDFGVSSQGPLGIDPVGVAVEANGNILVIDARAGTNGKGLLFRVHPVTKVRVLLSDFGVSSQGPLGIDPVGVAVEANGNILVIDPDAGTNGRGGLFRVNPGNGKRTLLSDFGSFTFGPLGTHPLGVAVEANGNILVVDPFAGTNSRGMLFRVNPQTGIRTPLTDFGIARPLGKGSFGLGNSPRDVAVEASGRILVVDSFAGSKGQLWTVDPQTGVRASLSNFGFPSQGPLGNEPIGVAVLRR